MFPSLRRTAERLLRHEVNGNMPILLLLWPVFGALICILTLVIGINVDSED